MAHITAEAVQIEPLVIAAILGVPTLLILLLLVLAGGGKKGETARNKERKV